jgi:hypothetical protein
MTFSITICRIITLSVMNMSTMTLSIMPLRIITHSLMTFSITIIKRDTQHDGSVV